MRSLRKSSTLPFGGIMKRSSLICLVFLALFSFGYRLNNSESGGVSKIYLHGNTLIRTTPGEGIKFYDLSNPASPRQRSAISISRNADVAVKANYMYADNHTDLVVFDISDLSKPVATDTIRHVFDRPVYYGDDMPVMDDEVIGGSSGCGDGCSSTAPADASPTAGRGEFTNGGTAGSLARFAVVGDYLYCIDDYTLHVYDVSDPARPRYRNRVAVSWDIETLFPYEDKLFIGGRSGMYVFDAADQEQPVQLSEFTHRRSCDPVVVENNRAYVTLRGGTACGGFDNQLDVIDISNIRMPKLLKSYKLAGPYGLSVRDGVVLVCDGDAGLVILDVKDAANIREIGRVNGVTAHDIILSGNLMVLSAQDNFYLYDISRIESPTLYTKLSF